MLIYLCGKKGSGKSTCCEILMKKGFVKTSFARPLKECIASLYNVDISLLDNLEFKEGKLEIPWEWNVDKFQELCKFFDIEADYRKIPVIMDEMCGGDRFFYTPREAMQYIGTDILRAIDPEFHVNRTIPLIEDLLNQGKSVCLDDVRFFNEKSKLEGLGKIGQGQSIGIYVDRKLESKDSHSSENTLLPEHFDYVIKNDSTKEELVGKFNLLLEYIGC